MDYYLTNKFSNDTINREFSTLNKLYPKFKGNDYYDVFYNDCLAKIALNKGNLKEAEHLGIENLKSAQEYGDVQLMVWMHETLEKIYKAQGNEAKADYHTKEIAISEAATKQNAIQDQLIYYQTIYETEKRDLTIKTQKTNISLLDEKNKVKNQWLLFGGLGALALLGFIWVLRSRNFAKRKHKLQENFTQNILKTQEQERARIASELHDNVGQKLLMIKNSLQLKETKSKNEIDLVGETIKEVREMSHNLHPFQFKKLGLVTSLKNMVATFQKNSNVFYSEDIEMENGRINKEKEIYVFRMLQEAMTNVEKHAEATACNLSSEEDKNNLIFTLKDNGKGFKTEQNNTDFEGLGMKTLKERALFIAATLHISSAPAKGTTVTIKIPKK